MYFKCPYSNFYMLDYRFRPDAPEKEFINKIDSNEKLFYERLAKLESKIELFDLQADTIKKAHENVIQTSEFVKEAAQLHSEAAESSFITNILLSIIDGIGILFGIPKGSSFVKLLMAIVKKLSNKHSADTISKTNALLDKADKLNASALDYLKKLKADIACKELKVKYGELENQYAKCQSIYKEKFKSSLMLRSPYYLVYYDLKNNYIFRLDYTTDIYMNGKTIVRAVKWQTSPAFNKNEYRNLTFEIINFKYWIKEDKYFWGNQPEESSAYKPKCYELILNYDIDAKWQQYNSETKNWVEKMRRFSYNNQHHCLMIPSNFELELVNSVIEYNLT